MVSTTPSTAKAALTLEWEEFSPGVETIENGFSEDLASDTEEGKATIVIIDVRTTVLFVKWDQRLVLPVLRHLLNVPDDVKQGHCEVAEIPA